MSFADYGRPRRVEGGMRARSTRGAIGESWWARRFLDVLESFALGTRLTRGRSYARTGQVLSVDIAAGVVTALVQGSRPKPYHATIRLQPFATPVWERIEVLLAQQAIYSARLLAGDLPPDLEEVFGQAGAPLFPRAVGELDMRCTCPDFAVPCKHLAATCYLLAEAFDADPFQILQWRGRSREQLLARLRTLRGAGTGDAPSPSAGAAPEGTAASVTPGCGAALALADLPVRALAESVDRFWLSPAPLTPRPPTLSTDPDLLLRQLGAPAAVIGGPGLVERLRPAYDRFGAQHEVLPEAVDPGADAPAGTVRE